MTITYKGELAEGREAQNLKGVRSYTRVFIFTSSADTEDAYDVGSHANAPVIGDTFHDGWCISSTPKCVSGRFGWHITAQYSSEFELAEDPTADPAKITVSTEQFQRPIIFDYNGQSVCNSAGDPFDPQEVMDDSRRVISVQKNVAVHPSWVLSMQDTVNSDTFTVGGIVYAIGTGKIQRVSISNELSRNGTTFYVLSFEIYCRRDGWLYEPLDCGFRELTYGGELINIVNPGDGLQPSAPVPLDGNGAALANPSLTNNVFRSYQIYPTASFASLPLT